MTRIRKYYRSTTTLFLLIAVVAHEHSHVSALAIFRRTTAPKLEDELGSSPTLEIILGRSSVYFDPFNLATDENFSRFREAELKHGRVAMLATLGMVLPNVIIDASNHIDVISLQNIPSGVAACKALSQHDWISVLLVCGFLEVFVFRQKDPRDMPGDYQTGYFGLRNKGLHERYVIPETCSFVYLGC